MTAKTVLFGGYGGYNVGDEAIAYSVCKRLAEPGIFGAVEQIICHRRPTSPAEELYQSLGCQPIAKKNLAVLTGSLRRNRLVIGGGQLLNGTRFPHGLLFILFMVALNRLFGHRPTLIGLGVTGMQHRLSRWIVAMIVRMADSVCVRDRSSLSQLRMATHSPKVQLAGDVVFSGAVLKLAAEPSRTLDQRETIVVAVRRDPGKRMRSSLDNPSAILQLCSAFPTKTIILAAHDVRPGYDSGVLKDFENAPPSNLLRYELTTLSETIAIYSRAAIVISSRMHPLILSTVCGGLPLAIEGSSKVSDLCDEFSLSRIPERFEPNELIQRVEELLSAIHPLTARLGDQLQAFQSRVDLNYNAKTTS